jgi:hypothetical protein
MSTTPRNASPSASVLLAEGVLLACASAIVYLATFLYEYGFCSYYGIPATLISPSLSTVLVAAAAIGGVFISSLKLLGLSAPLLRAARTSPSQGLRQLFAYNAIFLIVGILLAGIYGFSWRGAGLYVGLIAVFQLIHFLPVLIFDRKKPIKDRMNEYTSGSDPVDLLLLLEEWYGRKWVGPGTLLLMVLGLAYLVGHGEASRKESFLTLKDFPDTVVLRNYGELLIAAKLDGQSSIGDEIVLIWLSDKKQLSFVNRRLGPLAVASQAASQAASGMPSVAKPVSGPASTGERQQRSPINDAQPFVAPDLLQRASPASAGG